MSGEQIYQLKIRLLEISPMIWRRILISELATLAQLHYIIQIVMGWENYHLHSFHIHGCTYDEGDGPTPGSSEHTTRLVHLDLRPTETFYYRYDFGDWWEHEIRVENITSADPKKSYPICIGGRRACPPEDCGGPWGYMELLHILMDPLYPKDQELLEWVGPNFDPERFHRRPINKQLINKQLKSEPYRATR
jgi:hypothetical protein